MTTTTDTRQVNADPAIISTTTHASITSNPDTQNITITLAVDDFDLTDQLVITFAKSGSVACPEMLDGHSTSRLLYEIEQKGQDVTEPTLMAIAGDDGVARRVFITPCPGANFRDYAVWVGLVTETIQNLKALKVALYPCPGSLSDDNVFELIAQLVRSIIEAKCSENIALIVGRYNYNRLLNLALELKTELRTPSTMIQVIH